METAAIMRMKELVQKLDRAAKAYYQQDTEIISNREYDQMYDELQALEKETGTVLANSPTKEIANQGLTLLGVVPQDETVYEYDCEGRPTSTLPEDNPVKTALRAIVDNLKL